MEEFEQLIEKIDDALAIVEQNLKQASDTLRILREAL